MDTNLTQVAQAVIESIEHADEMSRFIDSGDTKPTIDPLSPSVATFTMMKWVDAPAHPSSDPSHTQPLGQLVYTVRVTAEWLPFDDG